MEIKVTDVGTHIARPAEADLGVHVGAVHVNLSAVLVDDLADIGDGLLEHAARTGIGDHERSEVLAMRFSFRFQIGHIDVARFIHAHWHHFEPGDYRTGRIGSMRRFRNQADIAMPCPRDA